MGEKFENELAHALLVLRVKLQEFHPNCKRLNRANHGRIDFNIELAGGGMQQQLDKGAPRKRGGCLYRAPSHGNVGDDPTDRGLIENE